MFEIFEARGIDSFDQLKRVTRPRLRTINRGLWRIDLIPTAGIIGCFGAFDHEGAGDFMIFSGDAQGSRRKLWKK